VGAAGGALAAIEIKLIAELHENHRVVPAGTARQRGTAYLLAWTHRRGIDLDPLTARASIGLAAKISIRRRLVRRAGRNRTTLGPMLSGAVAGSVFNHRETRRLGDQVRADLCRR
jgi:hypothetical protein